MRCPHGEARLRRSANDREDPLEARAFELHLIDCVTCANEQEALERARQEIQGLSIEPSTQALSRVRRRLRDATREERELRDTPTRSLVPAWAAAMIAGLGVAALIGVLALRFSSSAASATSLTANHARSEPNQLPMGRAVPILTPTLVQLGPVRLSLGAGAKVIFEAEGVDLQILEGQVHLEYDLASVGQSFVVETPTARISTLGCALRAEVDRGGARIAVERGIADVEPRTPGSGRTSLAAGNEIYVRTDRPSTEKPRNEPAIVETRSETQRSTPTKTPRKSTTPAPASTDTVREKEAAPSPSLPSTSAPVLPIATDSPTVRAGETLNKDAAISDRLASARSILSHDATRARQLAEAAIELKPSAAVEAEALMLSADACRRSGAKRAAIEYYVRVAEHVAGDPFAEEALLRAARLQAGDGDPLRALARLEEAAQRYPTGPLVPERTALASALLRGLGRIREAAAKLEAAPLERPSLALGRERLVTAEALVPLDPERAAELVLPLTSPGAARELRRPALELQLKAAELRGDRRTSGRLRQILQDIAEEVKE